MNEPQYPFNTGTGDHILAQKARSDAGRTQRGFVHEVRRDEICVSFHSSFDSNERYNIRFHYNRTPIRRQHQGLLAPSTSAQKLLLPIAGDEGITHAIGSTQNPVVLFDQRISSNAPQVQAVKSIINLRAGSAPFVIFGP